MQGLLEGFDYKHAKGFSCEIPLSLIFSMQPLAAAVESAGMPTWEIVKENVAPVKHGRDVNKIGEALLRSRTSIDAAKAAFEHKLSNESEDVLSSWLDYARYLEEAFPGDYGQALDVLERCARALKDDERYRNDERYTNVWLEYASALARPGELFRYLYKRKIGERVARMWVAWAESAEAEGKSRRAAEIYERGITSGAEPIWLIEKRLAEFQERQIQILGMPTPRDEAPARRPLANAVIGHRGRLRARLAQSSAVQTAENKITEIFVDDDLREPTALEDHNDHQDDDWPDFGTRLGRAKENTERPSRWTDAALGRRRAHQTDSTSVDIFIDDNVSDDHSHSTNRDSFADNLSSLRLRC